MEKGKLEKILLIVLVFLILVLVLLMIFKNDKKATFSKEIKIVTDASDFYTVSSCVSKYVNYLYNQDVDNLLVLLNQEYVKENNIDSSNIFTYINSITSYQQFRAKKMFYQQVDENVYKYYIYGILEEEYIDSTGKYMGDLYVIVYLNEEGMTFSIEPYDGEMFK